MFCRIFIILLAILVAFLFHYIQHDYERTSISGEATYKEVQYYWNTRNIDQDKQTPLGDFPGKERQHPFTAGAGKTGIHGDAGASDVHEQGPGGTMGIIRMWSRTGSKLPGGMCSTLSFNKRGYIIALCASIRRFELHLFEPRTLRLLAEFPLPNRPSTWAMFMTLDPTKVMLDTSGGAYYYLDNEDRVVLGDANQHIRRIGHRVTKAAEREEFGPGEPAIGFMDSIPPLFEFYDADDWDVNWMIPTDCMSWNNWFPSKHIEACDPITAVIPDFDGNIWFVTRRGIIGVLDPKKGKVVAKMHLHEEMQNGLTAGEDGVWIVTDFALYVMRLVPSSSASKKNNNVYKPQAATDGTDGSFEIEILWKTGYDRGTFRKVGMLSVGSGTTPTLWGGRFVTITDNKDDQIQLLVYDLKNLKIKRKRGEKIVPEDVSLVCQQGLFTPHQSASDNSMIAFGNSIYMENNFGYHNAIQQQRWSRQHIPGGIQRVDLELEDKKTDFPKVTGCKIVWENQARAPSCVAKLASSNGLLYYYTILDEPEDEEIKQTAEGIEIIPKIRKNNNNKKLLKGKEGGGKEDDDDDESTGGIWHMITWMLGIKSSDKKEPMWGLTAIDSRTGKTVFRVPTGRGRNFDNNWGSVTPGLVGDLYVSTIKGLVGFFDDADFFF